MNKIMDVYIANATEPDSEAYAILTLPAKPFVFFDALDKARVQQGDELYFQIEEYYAFESMEPFITDADSLAELNILCQKLSELDGRQSVAFEGLLKVEISKKDGPITIGKLIDLAYSADCCHVVDEARNDIQLGRFYAENGFVPDVEGLSDRLFDLLDFERIGRELRQGEGGVFTEHGYVTQHSELNEVYQDMSFKIRTPDYQVLLEVSKGHFDDPEYDSDRSVSLQLPAGEAAINDVLTTLDAASLDEIGYRCVDCRVPSLMDTITNAEDILAVNDFAERLQSIGDRPMLKLKAILSATGFDSMEEAFALANHLDEFSFEENISGFRDLALRELNSVMEAEDAALLAKYTDLNGYGKAIMERDHPAMTQYGLAQRKDGQPMDAPWAAQKTSGMEMM